MEVQPAPQFNLEHIEGHTVSLSDFRGRPVVVAFSGRDNAEEMAAGITELRRHYDHDQLPILAVADMGGIPRPARPIARHQLKKGYDDAVQTASAELQAAGKPVPPAPQLVIMLPDWSGDVAGSFGISDVSQQSAMVLVDAEGNVRGYGAGAQAAQQIMSLFA